MRLCRCWLASPMADALGNVPGLSSSRGGGRKKLTSSSVGMRTSKEGDDLSFSLFLFFWRYSVSEVIEDVAATYAMRIMRLSYLLAN